MNEQIEAYAKRLKLSWIRENYQQIEANSNQEYLLKLFEKEVQNREERRINLLLKQAQLPKTGDQPYQWEHIQIPQGISRTTVLNGDFIAITRKRPWPAARKTDGLHPPDWFRGYGCYKNGCRNGRRNYCL